MLKGVAPGANRIRWENTPPTRGAGRLANSRKDAREQTRPQPQLWYPWNDHTMKSLLAFRPSTLCMRAKSLQSCLTFVTPWTVARQAPLSLGFSRQEYWRRLPCPPPGDLPNPGIKPAPPAPPAWQVGSSPLAPLGSSQNCADIEQATNTRKNWLEDQRKALSRPRKIQLDNKSLIYLFICL